MDDPMNKSLDQPKRFKFSSQELIIGQFASISNLRLGRFKSFCGLSNTLLISIFFALFAILGFQTSNEDDSKNLHLICKVDRKHIPTISNLRLVRFKEQYMSKNSCYSISNLKRGRFKFLFPVSIIASAAQMI